MKHNLITRVERNIKRYAVADGFTEIKRNLPGKRYALNVVVSVRPVWALTAQERALMWNTRKHPKAALRETI